MHDFIRKYPSDTFYNSELINHKSVWTREFKQNQTFKDLDKLKVCFRRIVFFDLNYSKESPGETVSKFNESEVDFTFHLI